MEQIGDAIVDGRRGHKEYAAANDEAREGAIAVGIGIAETMGLVDNDKIAGLTACRPDGPHAKGFVGDDRRAEDAEPVEQCAPLWNEHRWRDQRERPLVRQRDCQCDVGLA